MKKNMTGMVISSKKNITTIQSLYFIPTNIIHLQRNLMQQRIVCLHQMEYNTQDQFQYNKQTTNWMMFPINLTGIK